MPPLGGKDHGPLSLEEGSLSGRRVHKAREEEEKLMPYYLVQAAFTKELIESLDEHPHNRLEEVRPVYEELGVTIREGFLAFGDYDVVLLCEAPDNVHMAAISMAVTAGGAVVHYKTTPLMTWDEGVEAMRIAGGSSYTPPS
jgi:uncharacterized protein with GYD domain